MRRSVLTSLLFSSAALLAPATALAQAAPGFSTQRFNPSERGSEWFQLDTLDLRGDARPAIGIVGEWANKPFVIYNADGSSRASVVDQQMFLHAGASLVLADRLRVGLNVPFSVIDSGSSGTSLNGSNWVAPQHLSLADWRAGADLRLFGTYGDALTMALGGQVFIPSGEAKQFAGNDNGAHGIVHLLASGESGMFVYSARLGVHLKSYITTADGVPNGSELVFGGAVGLRLADRKLVVGPEVYGATQTNSMFKGGTTPVEGLIGAHYTIGSDWRVGAGVGPGITHDLGSPHVRVIASIEWVPGYVPKTEVADRDGDGVPDDVDACPDVAGIKTDDPATNGCPAAAPAVKDRDGDGIPDSEDACPDEAGVKTDDPKTNGCPAKAPEPPKDTDGDGIPDSEDACPDKPGPKTDDPKTNGCPPNPDRDGDGIPNDVDACPDQAGPADPDPKKNGCPKAVVVAGKIEILEQIKFRFGSAVIDPASDPILTAVANVMKEHSEIKKIRVEGHTDNVGSAATNKKLSAARAAAVVTWLSKHGVDKERMSSEGFGMEKPIGDNKTEDGRKQNRRVEFHIAD